MTEALTLSGLPWTCSSEKTNTRNGMNIWPHCYASKSYLDLFFAFFRLSSLYYATWYRNHGSGGVLFPWPASERCQVSMTEILILTFFHWNLRALIIYDLIMCHLNFFKKLHGFIAWQTSSVMKYFKLLSRQQIFSPFLFLYLQLCRSSPLSGCWGQALLKVI